MDRTLDTLLIEQRQIELEIEQARVNEKINKIDLPKIKALYNELFNTGRIYWMSLPALHIKIEIHIWYNRLYDSCFDDIYIEVLSVVPLEQKDEMAFRTLIDQIDWNDPDIVEILYPHIKSSNRVQSYMKDCKTFMDDVDVMSDVYKTDIWSLLL